MTKARRYGEGSIYQRASDGLWIGTFDAGYKVNGTRNRPTVSGKTRAVVARKLRDRMREVEEQGATGFDRRRTVKSWAEEYLKMRLEGIGCKPLSPNGYKAAASPINKWIVPTIGSRKLCDLNAADIRKVHSALYDAGRKSATADVVHSNLAKMLRQAKAEGAMISDSVFLVEAPGSGTNDRRPISLEDSLRCLVVASELPHGLRWALGLVMGVRQGEVLGLTRECIDWEHDVIYLDWQLQTLTYRDTRDKSKGFKIPRDYEAIHLSGRHHLVRPKSQSGRRELPMPPSLARALEGWLEVCPPNPWGLVFPATNGSPAWHVDDREEWSAIQATVGVGHPSGRPYHVHEMRNTAATELDVVGASDLVQTSLMGHTQVSTTRIYQEARVEPKRAILTAMADRFNL